MKQISSKIWLYIVIAAKFTKLVKFVKIFKVLKFTKFLFSLATMLISAIAYSFVFGWYFAIGLVILLFIHELGHVIALKIKGYKVSAPIFIPMFGAIIFSPKFNNQEDEAFSAFGGPFLGGISALILFFLWMLNPQNHLLLLLSYIAVFINLFNLLPIKPIDGGRITYIIGHWFQYIGLGVLLLFTIYSKQPAMLLIWILVLGDIKFIKPIPKFIFGATCQAAMIIFMILGFSDQNTFVDIIDVILASVFNFFLITEAGIIGEVKSEEKIAEEKAEEKKVILAPLAVRMKWLFLYLFLSLSLTAILIWQLPYLQAIIPKP